MSISGYTNINKSRKYTGVFINNGSVYIHGIEEFKQVDQVQKITIETIDKEKEIVYINTNNISIKIKGNCSNVNTYNSSIIVKGNCDMVSTHNGPVKIDGDVSNRVTTHNGPVKISGSVKGSVRTYNGSIKHK